MFKEKIHTGIDINAAPALVWSVLADLARYPEWNPMIRSAAGELKRGSRLTLRFNPPGTGETVFCPKLMVVDPVRELRWQGRPGFPLLFESVHVFIIEPAAAGGSRLTHDMLFYGLLIPLARARIRRSIEGPFVLMNKALKAQAEKSNGQ
ncbi:MAG TPA: SRPBCC domain-containing protein [Spirochaetota bacterium]|nr:SRPBCC domain-containing protein [Spirochaetota bacterium]HOD14481.1 SRPBCC domain-containing protein [Spirochaetota bacterium]HPG51479.1 SRPBCC domain-containing protein [Spirochaetota bacterium]HPN11833.1 SRPBCC domain-containing protein [Spirochaetota bacterium]HQL83814.1 SRPBCC domain-containing protein [Spirochaetota bacterium]